MSPFCQANIGLRKTYGGLLLKQGRYHEAAQMFQKAVDVNPQDGDSWVALGRAFKEQGLWIFAEESIRHALRVGTHDLDVYSLYAQVVLHFFVGRDRSDGEAALSEAQSLLERAMALQWHNAATARLLFDVYGWLGNPKAANSLRQSLWFHFEGPDWAVERELRFAAMDGWDEKALELRLSSTTFPIFHYLQSHRYWPRNIAVSTWP
jgi:tetratricopeptide (TPR) repeat protein